MTPQGEKIAEIVALGNAHGVDQVVLIQKVCEALLLERERCAKIAESLYDVTYWDDPVAGIAAKIREGK